MSSARDCGSSLGCALGDDSSYVVRRRLVHLENDGARKYSCAHVRNEMRAHNYAARLQAADAAAANDDDDDDDGGDDDDDDEDDDDDDNACRRRCCRPCRERRRSFSRFVAAAAKKLSRLDRANS